MLDSFLCRTKLRSILPLLPLGISSHVRPSKLSPIITEINNIVKVPCNYLIVDILCQISSYFFYHLLKKNPPQNIFLFNIIKRSPNTPLLKKNPLAVEYMYQFFFLHETHLCIQGAYNCRLLYRCNVKTLNSVQGMQSWCDYKYQFCGL